MLKYSSLGVFLAMLGGIPMHVSAQPGHGDECHRALIPDTRLETLDSNQELALAITIRDRESWERVVRAGVQGAYGLFNAGGSYDQFEQRRQELLRQHNVNMSTELARRIFTSAVNQSVIDAWAHCQISRAGGIVVTTRQVSPRAATIRIYWQPVPGGAAIGTLEHVESRGAAQGRDDLMRILPRAWGPSQREFVLDRRPSEDLRFTVTINGLSDTVFVPASIEDRPQVYDTQAIVSVCSGTSTCDGAQWGVTSNPPTPLGDCIVTIRVPGPNSSQRIVRVDVIGRDPQVGNADEFRVLARPHPNAHDNGAFRQHIMLCGSVPNSQDRRANLRLGVIYR